MNNAETAATMAQEFDNTNAGNTEITARIVFTGNEYAENPDAVKLEITEQVKQEIEMARNFMANNGNDNFKCVEIDFYADMLAEETEEELGARWDEGGDYNGVYVEHDFMAKHQCLKVYRWGGVYYHACDKYDDTAIIKTDDLSKLIFPTADKV